MANAKQVSQLEKYLRGIGFPADKGILLWKIDKNGAPKDLIEMVEQLSKDNFNSAFEVIKTITTESR